MRAPEQDILPYIDMPEGMVLGEPLFYATSLPLGGCGRGFVVETREGRPIKVHGNELHPASRGATDVFAEAAVLDLFDPNRPRAPRKGGGLATWSRFEGELLARLGGDGAGFVLLTGPVASPTLARQIASFLERHPGARWHACPPDPDPLRPGGKGPRMAPDFSRAEVIVSFGCDFLGPGPSQIETARAFADARRGPRGRMRLHVLEAAPTLTGAAADHRIAGRPSRIAAAAEWLAASLEGEDVADPPEEMVRSLRQILSDLRGARGRAIVLAGDGAPGALSAALRLNAASGAPLDWQEAGETGGPEPEDAASLVASLVAGEVHSLLVLDCNPFHDLPEAAGLAEALPRAGWTACADAQDTETGEACLWRLPLNHPLEDWSDLRGPDGTVGLVQPMIGPLHDTRSVHEVAALLADRIGATARDLVRETWRRRDMDVGAFESVWRRALHDGVMPGTGSRPAKPPTAAPAISGEEGFDLVLFPSPTLWTGRYASNAWLQETPEPFTKQVWGNALWMAPPEAARLGLSEGDRVSIRSEWGEATLPVVPLEGQAPGTLGMAMGYGRRTGGPIGSGIGVSAAMLRPPDGRMTIGGISVSPVGGRADLLRTQTHFEEHDREILRTVTPEHPSLEPAGEDASFYPPWKYDGHAWGMVIDTDACIGCNACVTACQAENNIPVVGPDEVARGRIMHWLRVDAYRQEEGGTGFQPVPCMHCEQAPCEPVCPVAASVHDSEGLNVQVYNRCVGTRFCQANCPYKVRRFNFFGYADGEEYESQGANLLDALMNPDVTVRSRGVMEKCTYCVQRISRARRTATAEDRPIRDGEIATACQSACPTRAIAFGDLNDENSEVSRAKRDPRHYALLDHLGTRPRTTYLARVRPGKKA